MAEDDRDGAQRVGVMGGTFDPIHHGHLVAALSALEFLDLNRVLFVPAGDPWQKSDRSISPAENRVAMTRLAIAAEQRFEVCLVDVERAGATYAVDTLSDIAALHPGAELFFITGADALNGIFTWKEPDRLFELAHFVGCTRPDTELAPEVVGKIPPSRLTLLDIPALDISSTDLRSRAARGESLRYLVPDSVSDYVETNGLYREGTP